MRIARANLAFHGAPRRLAAGDASRRTGAFFFSRVTSAPVAPGEPIHAGPAGLCHHCHAPRGAGYLVTPYCCATCAEDAADLKENQG